MTIIKVSWLIRHHHQYSLPFPRKQLETVDLSIVFKICLTYVINKESMFIQYFIFDVYESLFSLILITVLLSKQPH